MRPTPSTTGGADLRAPVLEPALPPAALAAAIWADAPIAIVEIDSGGLCVSVSRAWSGITGQAPDRAAGDGWLDAVHDDDRVRVRSAVEASIATETSASLEFAVQGPAAQTRWVAAKLAPVPDPARGLLGVAVIALDMTDRRDNEAELAAIAEHAPDALVRLDGARRIVSANAAQARWTGIPIENYPGRTLWELGLPEDLVVRFEAAADEVMRTGSGVDLEFEAPTGDGPRWLHAHVVPECGADGRVDHVLFVSRDVTERRTMEETLRASDAMKTALVRGLSHEFRAPLAAISAAAGALERVDDEARRQELIGMVGEEAARLELLVTNLLDLSRLEGGVLVPRMDWCAVTDLVGGARRGAGVGLLGPGEPIVDLDSAHPIARADQVLTERILANLLRNAVIHGAPPVRITVRASTDRLRFIVEDEGPGVPPELAATAFEPFVRGPGRPGIGIGLALSRGFAEAQGGTLSVEQREGGGARFVLALPLLPVPGIPQ